MPDTLDTDLQQLWALVFVLVYDIEKRMTVHLAQHDLTPPQFWVLKTLTEHDGSAPIGQIARQHHLTNATMTGLVKRMEQMSPPLVGREASLDDRRSVTVRLTAAGEQRYLAVQQSLLEQLRAVLAMVSAEDRQRLLNDITRFASIVTTQFPVGTLA